MSSKRARTTGTSSRAGTSRNPRGNPPPSNPHGIIFKNKEQESRYKLLAKRKIVCTRYVDEQTLVMLGLKEDIVYMFGKVGWVQFMDGKWPTFEKITLEFLSSVEVNVLSSIEGDIRFRLFNVDRSFTLEQFNKVYGLPVGGYRRMPNEFNDHAFWQALTHEGKFDTRKAKATFIRNPCFRYVQRIMSHTLFGRGDSDGVVRQTELLFLWAMTNGYELDTGSHLARHFAKVGKAEAGSIVIGGLITPIALSLGLEAELQRLVALRGSTRIDIESCIAIKMITKQNDSFCLVFRGESVVLPLPNTARTTIRTQANWNIPMDGTEEPLQLIEYHPHTQDEGGPSHQQEQQDDQQDAGTYDFASIHHSLSDIHAEQQRQRGVMESMDTRIQSMEGMMQAVYQWHLSQGHFPPPPPQDP